MATRKKSIDDYNRQLGRIRLLRNELNERDNPTHDISNQRSRALATRVANASEAANRYKDIIKGKQRYKNAYRKGYHSVSGRELFKNGVWNDSLYEREKAGEREGAKVKYSTRTLMRKDASVAANIG